MKKSLRLVVFASLVAAFVGFSTQNTDAKDQWLEVRSKNFLLIGNASEKDIRKVATRLEQFRETFRQVFRGMSVTSPTPTTVIVFKSDASFKNFKPKRSDGKIDTGIAGYFQAGEDVNYITLSMEGTDEETFGTIFHEYVHFIVETNFGKSDVPTWFNEGLAEYYQTFAIVDDIKVKLGLPQGQHLFLLQQTELMPLDTLFGVGPRQLGNTGGHSRSIFYAQSWALMHYLLQSGKTEQLSKFLAALGSGTEPRKAFQHVFQTNYDKMELDLRNYVKQKKYNYNEVTFKFKLTFDADMTVKPLGDAVTNAYLGDLLYHTNRWDDAEPFLKDALKLDPNSGMANTALGMVKMRQEKFDEAKAFLEKAIAGDSKDHIALYRYAYILSREGRDENGFVSRLDSAVHAKMSEALKKAIALRPSFTPTYELLAFANVVNDVDLDESATLLKTALKYKPNDDRMMLRLAEILSRQGKLAEAGEIAEKIARTTIEPEFSSRSRQLLDYILQRREFDARSSATGGTGSGGPPRIIKRDRPLSEAEIAKMQEEANLRSINQALRVPADGETRVIGRVQSIDCRSRPIRFIIKTSIETFTLTSKDFQGLILAAFSEMAGNAQVGCEENISAFAAVITFKAAAAPKLNVKGELIAIEFVPQDFRLIDRSQLGVHSYVVYDDPGLANQY